MSVEFDTPANRIIAQQQPKNQFNVNTTLPDITFLRHLSVQGRLRFFTGSGVTPITIIPNVGETLFIYGGRIFGLNALAATVIFQNDGNIREQFNVPSGSAFQAELSFKMDSLVGDNIKSYSVTVSQTGFDVSLFGWVENTSRIRDVTT